MAILLRALRIGNEVSRIIAWPEWPVPDLATPDANRFSFCGRVTWATWQPSRHGETLHPAAQRSV